MITAIEVVEQKQKSSYSRDVKIKRWEELYKEQKAYWNKNPILSKRKRLRRELDLYSFQIGVLSQSNKKLKKKNKRLKNSLKSNENNLMELKQLMNFDRINISMLIELLIENKEEFNEYKEKLHDCDEQIKSLSIQKDKFKQLWSDLKIQKASNLNLNVIENELEDNSKWKLRSLNDVSRDLNSMNNCEVKDVYKSLLLDKIKKIIVCPLSGEQLRNPVVLPSGVTVEQKFYDNLVDENTRDPFNPSLNISESRVNRLALDLIFVVEKIENSSFNESILDKF